MSLKFEFEKDIWKVEVKKKNEAKRNANGAILPAINKCCTIEINWNSLMEKMKNSIENYENSMKRWIEQIEQRRLLILSRIENGRGDWKDVWRGLHGEVSDRL